MVSPGMWNLGHFPHQDFLGYHLPQHAAAFPIANLSGICLQKVLKVSIS